MKFTKKIVSLLLGLALTLVVISSLSSCILSVTLDLGEQKKGTVELQESKVTDDLSIDANLDFVDFSIVRGETFCVNYDIPEKLIPEVTLSKNKLTVNRQNNDKLLNIGPEIKTRKIEVVVPEEIDINKIFVNLDMGDLKIPDMDCDEITATVDMGDVIITNCICTTIIGTVDMGDFKLTDADCNSVQAIVDMGDITISGDFNKITANCDMGDINIDSDCEAITATADMGDVKINGKKQ